MAVLCSIENSIQEVDSQTWVVGAKFLLTSSPDSPWGYIISDVSGAPPTSRPLSSKSLDLIRLVHNAGGSSAVWAIGDVFLKVKSCENPETTREHATLAFLKTINLSFAIPNVIFHAEWAGRQYLVLSKVPGRTLADTWPEMDKVTQEKYVERVVDVCNELANDFPQSHHSDFQETEEADTSLPSTARQLRPRAALPHSVAPR